LQEADADQSAGENQEGEMNVRTSLVADRESAETSDPGQRPFHPPAMPAQALTAVDPAAGHSGDDPAVAQSLAAAWEVERFVGMQLARPMTWPPASLADRRNAIDDRLQEEAVVNIGRATSGMPGRSTTICRFAPGLPRSVGFGPICSPPPFAAKLALSSAHRLQSMTPARPSRLSRRGWKACQMPALGLSAEQSSTWRQCLLCKHESQSRKRRQHVIPEPQPISCGSISQGVVLQSS
jgi:hypothetical protein